MIIHDYSGVTNTNGVTVTPMSLYYKFVAVRQGEESLSSSPGRLSIYFCSKALVGENRALSFLHVMAMIVTPPCSPDVSFAPSLRPR
jgi:hypothetical protein